MQAEKSEYGNNWSEYQIKKSGGLAMAQASFPLGR